MKKIVTILTVSCMALFFACGPSADEKALEDKRIADSTAAALAAQKSADSLVALMKEDSLKDKILQDSLANAAANAGAKGSKGSGTTGPKKTTEEKDLDKINDMKGGGTTKTPAQEKKEKEDLKTIKGMKGGGN